MATTGHWIEDRTEGNVVTSINGTEISPTIAKRFALPIMTWEGLTITSDGVIYAGDELRTGTGVLDNNGGAIFKFVPEKPYTGGAVWPMDKSPFVSGKVYAMQVSCREASDSRFPQYGQGCEVGDAAWVEVSAEFAASTQTPVVLLDTVVRRVFTTIPCAKVKVFAGALPTPSVPRVTPLVRLFVLSTRSC